MKELAEIQKKLKEPFSEHDLEWRIARCGEKNGKPWAQVLAYITSRAVMDRLDSVFGLGGWKDEYTHAPDGGVLCSLSIKINGEWITKQDVAENTNIEAVKGGVSGALKRAAVKFGIGRYLYKLTDNFAIISDSGEHYQPKDRNGKYQAFKWNPPKLPHWALQLADEKAKDALKELSVNLEALTMGQDADFLNREIQDSCLTRDKAMDLYKRYNAKIKEAN